MQKTFLLWLAPVLLSVSGCAMDYGYWPEAEPDGEETDGSEESTPELVSREPQGGECILPEEVSGSPIDSCGGVDWSPSDDGLYWVSQFGSDADGTTRGRTTSCGTLAMHYAGRGCRYDNHAGACLDDAADIPWVQGHVDHALADMQAAIDAAAGGDVAAPEHFYVAGAQRFGCGALLRITSSESSECVVVYTEDAGPSARLEDDAYAAGRIMDVSPAVIRTLGIERHGWSGSTAVYVEHALPGDVPGQRCTPCESAPAIDHAAPHDLSHMLNGVVCR